MSAMPGHVIDWQEVRERLGRVAHATECAQRLSPVQAKARMDERARRLAEPHVNPAHAAEALSVVTFALHRERYAVEARYVREIVRWVEPARVPGAPTFLLGVVNLRGELLPVVDLRAMFDVAVAAPTALSRTIVLGRERAELGVLADAVHEVTALTGEEVLPTPAFTAVVGRAYLRGVTADSLIVLDAEAVLSDERLFFDHRPEH
jgi:purine-binding chemotaxis protein CheW